MVRKLHVAGYGALAGRAFCNDLYVGGLQRLFRTRQLHAFGSTLPLASMESTVPAPRTDLIGGLVLLALGLGIWLYTGTFPELDDGHPGPALFPRLIAAGLVLAGLGLAVGGLRRRRTAPAVDARETDWSGLARLAGVLALALAIPVVYPWVGFVPGVSALSVAVALLLGARWPMALGVGIGGALLIYALFTELLGVPL